MGTFQSNFKSQIFLPGVGRDQTQKGVNDNIALLSAGCVNNQQIYTSGGHHAAECLYGTKVKKQVGGGFIHTEGEEQ